MRNCSSLGTKVPNSLILPASCRILAQRQKVHAALHGVLQHGRQHKRPVDLQCGLTLFDRQPCGGRVAAGDRRIGSGGVGHRLEDPQCVYGGGPVRGGVGQRDVVAVFGEHLTAAADQQRVEPDHQALALVGLHSYPAGLACGVQPGRLGHHAHSSLRWLLHQICSVPKQLGIGRDGCARTACASSGPSPAGLAGCRRWRRPRHDPPGRRTAAVPSPPRRIRPSTPRPAPSHPACGRDRSAAGPTAIAARRGSGQADLLNHEPAVGVPGAVLGNRGERRAESSAGV